MMIGPVVRIARDGTVLSVGGPSPWGLDCTYHDEEPMLIKPTVGRVVWFYQRSDGSTVPTALAAMVAHVHSDRMVNLMVVEEDGSTRGQTSVQLLQDDDKPDGGACWCAWMPYQLGQAAKTEAAEAKGRP